jgi:hypothetical protein
VDVSVVAARPSDRTTAAVILGSAVPWLVYTRLYFWLHPKHLTFDPSLFMYLTGRPDPFCGLTRTFAWMWRGDVGRAALVYPLGPLVFVASFLLVGYALYSLASGRAVQFSVSPRTTRVLIAIPLLALAANWAAKLLWLGM